MASTFSRLSLRIGVVNDEHLGSQALGSGLVFALPLAEDIHHAESVGKTRRDLLVKELLAIRASLTPCPG